LEGGGGSYNMVVVVVVGDYSTDGGDYSGGGCDYNGCGAGLLLLVVLLLVVSATPSMNCPIIDPSGTAVGKLRMRVKWGRGKCNVRVAAPLCRLASWFWVMIAIVPRFL
jgi:hypothetical protein